MAKESITGYLNMCRDVARFENNLEIQYGTLYYAPTVGFDRRFFLSSEIQFSAASFNLWVMNQASLQGILIIDSRVSVEDYALKVKYTIAGAVGANTFSLGF